MLKNVLNIKTMCALSESIGSSHEENSLVDSAHDRVFELGIECYSWRDVIFTSSAQVESKVCYRFVAFAVALAHHGESGKRIGTELGCYAEEVVRIGIEVPHVEAIVAEVIVERGFGSFQKPDTLHLSYSSAWRIYHR